MYFGIAKVDNSKNIWKIQSCFPSGFFRSTFSAFSFIVFPSSSSFVHRARENRASSGHPGKEWHEEYCEDVTSSVFLRWCDGVPEHYGKCNKHFPWLHRWRCPRITLCRRSFSSSWSRCSWPVVLPSPGNLEHRATRIRSRPPPGHSGVSCAASDSASRPEEEPIESLSRRSPFSALID